MVRSPDKGFGIRPDGSPEGYAKPPNNPVAGPRDYHHGYRGVDATSRQIEGSPDHYPTTSAEQVGSNVGEEEVEIE